MIIVRVPFRVSLFGGGTDFKHFYSNKKSSVVSFSIDKYCYVNVRKLLPYFGFKYRVSWSLIQETSSVEEITHPSIRACLDYLNINDGLEIHTVGDLPARSGLGSSSSFTAAMLASLYIYKNKSYSNSEIADQTIHIEQKILKENVGIQDQIQVCLGGFNVTTIFQDSTYSTLSLNNTSEFVRLIDQSLILVYTGISRYSSNIHSLNDKNIDKSLKQKSLDKIHSIANTFSEHLINHKADFKIFSDLMQESWEAKVSSFPDNELRQRLLAIYDKGIKSGATCGKLLGAGGGGFYAFFVEKEKQDKFIFSMKEFICVPCSIAFSGVQKVHHDNL